MTSLFTRREFLNRSILAAGVLHLPPFWETQRNGDDGGHGRRRAPQDDDYCALLARDIAGREHGFLTGSRMYYVGGNRFWHAGEEDETLGFTHPFFHDGRARGHTLITNHLGTGHDMWGWEFWRQVRGAYGSVVVDGRVVRHPKPASMIWRPDRQVCRYEVGDVVIDETKFIARNDVVCAIITSNKPVTLRFEGCSYVNTLPIYTVDGDPPNTPYSQKREATARFVAADNVIHLIENGTALGKPDYGWGVPNRQFPAVEGPMMYSGLSVVLSASRDLAGTQRIRQDQDGRQCYEFELPCDASGLVLTYAIGDRYDETVERTKSVLSAPKQALEEKTTWFNGLLNFQIPRFRCSDELAVQTYYYLWAIYFMYFTEPGEGWEKYRHTQTAINNFLGLHIWDSYAYIRMGAWTTDQQRWGQGNVLAWSSMVDVVDGIIKGGRIPDFWDPSDESNPVVVKPGRVPDNFGVAWFSPSFIEMDGLVEGAWQQYRHSGDRRFLAEAYVMYRKSFYDAWPSDMASLWTTGFSLTAARSLADMAATLGRSEDVAHWNAARERLVEVLHRGWEQGAPDFFGPVTMWKDNTALAIMQAPDMPDEWAQRMVRRWVMDTEKGFYSPIGIKVRAHDSTENGPFVVSTLSTWQVIEGMFRHGCDEPAVHATLRHLHGMVRDFGYPVAPECWNSDYEPFFDLHYNWDGVMVLLLLERLAGVHIDLPEQRLTVEDHLPKDWSFVEVQLPISDGTETPWTTIRVKRTGTPGQATKSVAVRNCPLRHMTIRPWDEERSIVGESQPSYSFTGQPNVDVQLELGSYNTPTPLRAWVTPRPRAFLDSVTLRIENLDEGSEIRYTLDGVDPTPAAPLGDAPITVTQSSTLKLRAFSPDRLPSEVQTIELTRMSLRPPVSIADVSPGARFRIYRGRWTTMPDFDRLIPVQSGVADVIDLTVASEFEEDYLVVFDGLLEVDRDGVFSLSTRAYNTSAVYVGDQLVTLLPLWRNVIDAYSASGEIALAVGKHPLRVVCFQEKGRRTLDIGLATRDGQPTELQLWHASAP